MVCLREHGEQRQSTNVFCTAMRMLSPEDTLRHGLLQRFADPSGTHSEEEEQDQVQNQLGYFIETFYCHQQLTALQHQVQQLTDALAQERKQQHARTQELERSLSAAMTKNERLEERVETLTAEKDHLHSVVGNAERTRGQAEQTEQSHRQEIEKLKMEMLDLHRNAYDARKELKKETLRVKTLLIDIEKYNKMRQMYLQQLNDKTQALEAKEQQLEVKTKQCEELAHTLAATMAELDDTKDKLNVLAWRTALLSSELTKHEVLNVQPTPQEQKALTDVTHVKESFKTPAEAITGTLTELISKAPEGAAMGGGFSGY